MILFLYGEDIWRKNAKLKQISKRFTSEADPSRMNLSVWEAGDLEEETLRSRLLAMPFLARKRLVVIKNLLLGNRKKGLIEPFFKSIQELGKQTVLVVSEDGGRPKSFKSKEIQAVWEYLVKHATTEEFPVLSGAKLEAAIMGQAKAQGLGLAREAASVLAILCNGDLGQAEQELGKLWAYCTGRSVTREDVKTVCISAAEANFFDFLDALGGKDQRTMMRTLGEQLEESEPLALMSRIIAHVRALLAVTLKGEAGGQALRLHPFQLRKIVAQTRKWDAAALKKVLLQLAALDFSIKRGRAADPRAQLTALLARTIM